MDSCHYRWMENMYVYEVRRDGAAGRSGVSGIREQALQLMRRRDFNRRMSL